jgi:pimeloyl-ACP methyl ester carboxylesterase
MLLPVLLCIIAILILGAAITAIGVAHIERAHRPAGVFVPVTGGRLHVVDLAPARPTNAPPIVLLHGASGNLEDLRLALGGLLARSHRVILIDRPGHGFSDRPGGVSDASPGRQAALIAEALARLGVARAIMAGFSLSGAVAAAYALDFPDRIAGLVLLAPVTHPWNGGIGWYNKLAAAPLVGALFAHTLALPLGLVMFARSAASTFAPQMVPRDYARRAAGHLVLRPPEFVANAQDLAALKAFVTAQVPRYREIAAPTVIITGDRDSTVSPEINARAAAALIPNAKLVLLRGIGHMVTHAAAEAIATEIETIAANSE